jgi:hypothetical protein
LRKSSHRYSLEADRIQARAAPKRQTPRAAIGQ